MANNWGNSHLNGQFNGYGFPAVPGAATGGGFETNGSGSMGIGGLNTRVEVRSKMNDIAPMITKFIQRQIGEGVEGVLKVLPLRHNDGIDVKGEILVFPTYSLQQIVPSVRADPVGFKRKQINMKLVNFGRIVEFRAPNLATAEGMQALALQIKQIRVAVYEKLAQLALVQLLAAPASAQRLVEEEVPEDRIPEYVDNYNACFGCVQKGERAFADVVSRAIQRMSKFKVSASAIIAREGVMRHMSHDPKATDFSSSGKAYDIATPKGRGRVVEGLNLIEVGAMGETEAHDAMARSVTFGEFYLLRPNQSILIPDQKSRMPKMLSYDVLNAAGGLVESQLGSPAAAGESILVFRHPTFQTSSAIVTPAGSDLGETFYHLPNTMAAADAGTKNGFINLTVHLGALVYQPHLPQVMPDAYIMRYKQGRSTAPQGSLEQNARSAAAWARDRTDKKDLLFVPITAAQADSIGEFINTACEEGMTKWLGAPQTFDNFVGGLADDTLENRVRAVLARAGCALERDVLMEVQNVTGTRFGSMAFLGEHYIMNSGDAAVAAGALAQRQFYVRGTGPLAGIDDPRVVQGVHAQRGGMLREYRS